MIAQKHRFRGHNSVSRVRGGRIQNKYFKVFYARNHRRSDYRMAVVVSKKTAKSAVSRNRIRRRLFEAVRKQAILQGNNIDTVFVVHSAALENSEATELEALVKKACQKIISDTRQKT